MMNVARTASGVIFRIWIWKWDLELDPELYTELDPDPELYPELDPDLETDM
jgi:hypothetical protein